MLITWEGGGVALARCGLDEQREEVELEGPGEAKTWLGESFILAMKRNHAIGNAIEINGTHALVSVLNAHPCNLYFSLLM